MSFQNRLEYNYVTSHRVNFSFPKKLRVGIALVLVFALVAPASFLLAPQTARAQGLTVPVWDVPNTPNQYVTGVATWFEKLKDFGFDSIAWIVAKIVMRQITANLVQWINNGFNGNPIFINDPAGFFLGIGDAIAGDFIRHSPLGFLCSPLKGMGLSIRASLTVNYFGKFGLNRSCTITGIANNVANLQNAPLFLSGSVTARANTGWDTWLNITQVPANNIYGASALAQGEMSARIAGAQATNRTVANWGQGYKSQVNAGLIITPGNTIKDALHKALGSDQDAMVAADELGEMVTAIAGALMTKMITTGLASLSNTGSSQSNISSANLSTPTQQDQTTQAQQAQYTNVNGAETQAAQNSVDTTSATIEQQARTTLANQTSGGVTQNARINLSSARTSEYPCITASTYGGQSSLVSYPASKAVDGSTDSTSWNICALKKFSAPAGLYPAANPEGTATPTAPGSWTLDLTDAGPAVLDSVEFDADGSDWWWLQAWTQIVGGQTVSVGPKLALIDTAGIRYEVTLPDHSISGTVKTRTDLPSLGHSVKIAKVIIEALTQNNDQDIGTNPSGDALYDRGIKLREVRLFRHLHPTVDTTALPSALSAASTGATFNPLTGVTATYYPFYSTPTAVDLTATPYPITASIKNNTTGTVLPSAATYALTPGTYTITYTVTVAGEPETGTATKTVNVTQ